MCALPFSPERLAALPAPLLARPELGPLLYASFADDGARDRIPGDPIAARREYYASLARSTVLLSRATTLLDEAKRAGLELLPIKGAVFASALYHNPGARPMSDLDFLVRPRDLDAVCALVEQLGYARMYSGRVRFTPEHGHDVAYQGNGVQVELHYKLHHELGMDARVDRLFDRAIEIELLGEKRRVPCWDDHLFLTAVHAATHALAESPIWIFDVVLAIAEAGSAEGALAEAVHRRARYPFCAAMKIARRFFPELIPELPSHATDAFRERLLDAILGVERMASAPSQLRSLLARTVLTDSPFVAVREITRKVRLRAREVFETRTGS